MAAGSSDGFADFEASLRRGWEALSGMAGSQGQEAWQRGAEHWQRAFGLPAGSGASAMPGADWFSLMQEVVGRFAGKDTTAAELAQAWQQALRGQFPGLWASPPPGGTPEALFATFAPWLEMPAFGPLREYQARWQAQARDQQHYQQQLQAYLQQLRKVLDDACALFEHRLEQHSQPGEQLDSVRALFNLWIEVAEEAYARVAGSEEFQSIYGELANAQMRVRAAAQAEMERVCVAAGVPTRTEMDAAHRKIAELERELRRMMREAAAGPAGPAGAKPAGKPARTNSTASAAPRKAPAKKPAAAKPGPSPRTPGKKGPAR